MPHAPLRALAIAIALAVLGHAPDSLAAWQPQGDPLGDGFRPQEVAALLPDGAHGAFVVRVPSVLPGPDGLHAFRVTSAGEAWPGWPDSGVAFAANLINFVQDVSVCPDGAGGLFVAWTGQTVQRVSNTFATRIGPDGTFAPGWTASGKQVGDGPGFDRYPRVVSDGSGGVLVVWSRVAAPPSYPVVALRLTATGSTAPAWPDTGVWLSATPEIKALNALVPDGSGGAVAAWLGHRIGLQRVTSAGTIAPGWAADGIPAGTGPDTQRSASLAPAPDGGAFVGWDDTRDTFLEPRSAPFLLRITSDASIAGGWPADGLRISNPFGTMGDLVADGSGGVYVAWLGTPPVRVSRVTSAGTPAPGWPASGVPASTPPSAAVPGPRLAVLPDGGVVVAWASGNGGATDIYSQRFGSDGVVNVAWPPSGVGVCTTAEPQNTPFVADGGGGASFVAWADGRGGSGSGDVYIQRLDATGLAGSTVGVPPVRGPERLRLSIARPNPGGERVTLDLILPVDATVSATMLDVRGRIVRQLMRDVMVPAGHRTLTWDGRDDAGRETPAGIYLFQVRSSAGDATRRVARVR
jgi:hypothetical protein